MLLLICSHTGDRTDKGCMIGAGVDEAFGIQAIRRAPPSQERFIAKFTPGIGREARARHPVMPLALDIRAKDEDILQDRPKRDRVQIIAIRGKKPLAQAAPMVKQCFGSGMSHFNPPCPVRPLREAVLVCWRDAKLLARPTEGEVSRACASPAAPLQQPGCATAVKVKKSLLLSFR